MIALPTFNIGIRSFAEATSQLSRIVDIIRNSFQLAVTLVDIANAVRSGELSLDRLQTNNAQLLLQNGFLKLREFDHAHSSGTLNLDGGVLFVKNGALNYQGSANTTTVVAPA